jgi:hypothetical protein
MQLLRHFNDTGTSSFESVLVIVIILYLYGSLQHWIFLHFWLYRQTNITTIHF